MSDTVHVFIEKTAKGRRHIVAFSVGDKDHTEQYAKYNAVEEAPDLEHFELNLTDVNLACNYILSNLDLVMVDKLLKPKVSAA
jgi:hypothetical protein